MTKLLEPHVTAARVSAAIGYSTRWVKEQLKNGTFDGFMSKRDYMVNVASVNRWIRAASGKTADGGRTMAKLIEAHEKAWRVGALLDKSTRWVKEQVKNGAFEGFLTERDYMVNVASVNRWIDARRLRKPDQIGGAD